ncbi:MAG: hypothetical protein M0D57_06520 [Sphingobacteriales bacterium JAD_PAG50586_3]|nr:MAG: hypothetical protein M0D57_06520 [Sphingobacteriales bacterium JAD_PAG50586_3]
MFGFVTHCAYSIYSATTKQYGPGLGFYSVNTIIMKNLVVIAVSALSVVVVGFVACSNPKMKMKAVDTKVFNGTVAIENPNSELNIAKRDSIANYKKFRADAIAKLSRNITKISQYRSAIDTSQACVDKAACEQVADSLTAKNNELIVKLDNGKADKNWKKFKRELSSNLDKLSFTIGSVTTGKQN